MRGSRVGTHFFSCCPSYALGICRCRISTPLLGSGLLCKTCHLNGKSKIQTVRRRRIQAMVIAVLISVCPPSSVCPSRPTLARASSRSLAACSRRSLRSSRSSVWSRRAPSSSSREERSLLSVTSWCTKASSRSYKRERQKRIRSPQSARLTSGIRKHGFSSSRVVQEPSGYDRHMSEVARKLNAFEHPI